MNGPDDTVKGGVLPPTGPVCHCGMVTVVRMGKHGEYYRCPRYPECDGVARFATAKVSTKAQRAARTAAHAAFDRIWQEGWMRREAAYAMLSAEFKVSHAHIADMGEDDCERVIAWSERKLQELKRQGSQKKGSRR